MSEAGRRAAVEAAGLTYGELLRLTEGHGTGEIYERIDTALARAVAEERERLLETGRRAHRFYCSGPSPCDGCSMLDAIGRAAAPAK